MDICKYRSDTPAAGTPYVEIGKEPVDWVFRPCARVTVDDPQPGDVFLVTSSTEVTQDNYCRVMVGHYLTAGTATGYRRGNPNVGDNETIDRPMGTNFDRYIHHLTVRNAGVYVAPSPTPPQIHFQQYLYSHSLEDSGWDEGDHLILEYADTTVLRFRHESLDLPDYTGQFAALRHRIETLEAQVAGLESFHPLITFGETEFK